jgi:SynChlorMet cassette protein ScmC
MIENCQMKITIADEYHLILGNGQGWQFTSTPGVTSEVRELGRIMGLKCCEPNGYQKLVFIRRGSEKIKSEDTMYKQHRNMEATLRRLGWKARDLKSIKLWSHNDVPDMICEITHGEGDYELSILSMRLSLYPIYERELNSGGLPFHAGLVERDGKGVLLAAPKNIGKSTCCRRIPGPWNALCDEETLIVRDGQKQYLAHPFPTWSDYLTRGSNRTWNVQRYVPLAAIFFLEQAEDDKAIPLGQGEAASLMNQSAMQVFLRSCIHLDREKMRAFRKKLFDNACELAGAIPTFKLRVGLDGRFWEKIEAVLF